MTHSMKKKLAAVMVAMILLPLLTGCASALMESDPNRIDLSTQTGAIMVTRGGSYTLTGTLNDGQIVVDAPEDEKVELILSNAEIASSSSAAIDCRQAKDLIVTLADNTQNTLTDAASYHYDDPDQDEPNAALFSKADLLIRGNGSLRVQGNYKHGIASKDDLKIEGGAITVISVSDALRGKDSVTVEDGTIVLQAGKDGISATNEQNADKGRVEISGGSFTITAAGDGIQAEQALSITGGSFSITTEGISSGTSDSQKGIKAGNRIAIDNGTFQLNTRDDAIHSNLDATINSGTFTIETGDDGVHAARDLVINGGAFNIPVCHEGFEATTITFNGGDIFIDSEDDAIGAAAGTEEARSFEGWDGNPYITVTINGGSIEAVSGGDTVDSNGNIFVSGGRLRLNSPAVPYYEGCLLCNGRVTVTGGDIAFVGNIGVELTVENQPMLLVSYARGKGAGTVVSLRDQSGKTLLETLARRDYTQSVFSSPELQVGETYSVYVDDERITDVTLTGAINKAADDGGAFTGGYPRGHW